MFSVLVVWLSISFSPQLPSPSPSTRPCATGWDRPSPSKSKNGQSQRTEKSPKTAATCIELGFSQIEAQEYLQSFVRRQKWKITDEHVSEDLWTFSRELDPDELMKDAKPDSTTSKIEWTKGTVVIHVEGLQLPNGWTRTVIKANFRGYGQNADQFATQREYWELESRNRLESLLVETLTDHFKVKEY